jgi:predicted transglutaminase-like cysteine proteinase
LTSPARSSELAAVNRQANRDMEPASDIDGIGQLEYCTIPRSATGKDDALRKRKLLLALGWSSSALLITVVLA